MNYEIIYNEKHSCYEIVETNKPCDNEKIFSDYFEALLYLLVLSSCLDLF